MIEASQVVGAQMVRRMTAALWVAAALVVALGTGVPERAWAQSDDEDDESYLDKEPTVRRKLLFRSTRVEVAPIVSVTLNDAFNRNMLVGANIYYHLTNEFGIGVTGGFGLLQMNTDLRNNIETTLQASSQSDLDQLSFSYVQWLVQPELSYVPFFGKFNFIGNMILNWDFHLLVGVGFINRGAEAASAGGSVDSTLEGLRIAPAIGVGARLFLGDMFSLNINLRDYIYSRAEVSNGTVDEELHNNLMTSIGIGIFFPSDVKISR